MEDVSSDEAPSVTTIDELERRQRELEAHVASTATTSSHTADNLREVRLQLVKLNQTADSIRACAFVAASCAVICTLAVLSRL